MPHLMVPSEALDTARPSSAESEFTAKILPFRHREAIKGHPDATASRDLLHRVEQDRVERDRVEQDLGPLRRQVSSIIDEILAENGPADERVRERLRFHVEKNPGEPERALLKHLLSSPVTGTTPGQDIDSAQDHEPV